MPVMTVPDQTMRVRSKVLETANSLVAGDREQTYGDAAESFERIATFWSAIIGVDVTPTDVARCMIALKLSRLQGNDEHRDSWVDIAGYAALGAELAQ